MAILLLITNMTKVFTSSYVQPPEISFSQNGGQDGQFLAAIMSMPQDRTCDTFTSSFSMLPNANLTLFCDYMWCNGTLIGIFPESIPITHKVR